MMMMMPMHEGKLYWTWKLVVEQDYWEQVLMRDDDRKMDVKFDEEDELGVGGILFQSVPFYCFQSFILLLCVCVYYPLGQSMYAIQRKTKLILFYLFYVKSTHF